MKSQLALRSSSPWFRLLATFLICVALLAVFFLAETLSAGGAPADVRPALLCLCLLGFSIVSYVAWPSRWNIVAHSQLAFGIVAYIIPLLLLGGGRSVTDESLDLYTTIMVVGFSCSVIGTIVGSQLAGRPGNSRVTDAVMIPLTRIRHSIPHRVVWGALLSIAGLLLAFLVMGFVPALAADPFAAKFFRGAYAESYAPVAPLYRATTSALAVLLPLLTMYAVWRRKPLMIAVFLTSVVLLLLTLQREPAVSGILLFVGVLVALRTRGMLLYFIGIVAVYFAGSASYFVFAALGIGNFSAGVNPVGLLASVAAGAPDVADQFIFLQAWLKNPIFAHGLTFIGGLVPGNFEWNPSVWSLAVTNPGADVTTINSGGYRLPGPLWGYVNLGWVGAAGVGLVFGLVTGYLAGTVSAIISQQTASTSRNAKYSREATVLTFIAYAAVVDCLTQFYALSYVSVIQTSLLVAIVYLGHNLTLRRRRPFVATVKEADAHP
ncbi:hypothetical protein E3O42_16880 [Cryobacterium adonitolivorans]|uniref:Oligosaccharide repeat unit polymerase n=1 Tax=Cryobacterium adonitolivorans TaxID=1259189 RepID=A0A4R8VXX1_9MICO|nr:hypothetical protein [Cryobacterium adonitolivorans]TFB96812.1 hypothetical protein E3O42_16880 [Cryobacterium adonitolivorans]